MKTSLLKKVDITMVVTDRSKYINKLWSQFGLSMFIDFTWEDDSKKCILFDTGWESGPVLHNLNSLNIKLESIDYLVLSHCHYDHTGGLYNIVRNLNSRFKFIAHKEIFRPVYTDDPDVNFIGVKKDAIDNIPKNRIKMIEDPYEILPNVWLTGTIPRVTDFEKPEKGVFIVEDKKFVPDPEKDDMAIVVDMKEKGIIVITGCGHAGIINTIKHSKKITGNNKVRSLVGGFHLIDVEEITRNKTIEMLTKIELESVYTGHCTGFDAEERLFNILGNKFNMFYTGDVINFN